MKMVLGPCSSPRKCFFKFNSCETVTNTSRLDELLLALRFGCESALRCAGTADGRGLVPRKWTPFWLRLARVQRMYRVGSLISAITEVP